MKCSNLFVLSTHYCENFKTTFIYDLVSWMQIKIWKKTHASCSNTRKIAAQNRVSRFATVSQQPSGCWRNSAFGIDQLALFNLIYQHRLCYLPQHCVVTKNPSYIHYKASFLSCLSQQCFHITELSSRRSKSWKFSLPWVYMYTLLDVSPTYFDLQAWQTNSCNARISAWSLPISPAEKAVSISVSPLFEGVWSL